MVLSFLEGLLWLTLNVYHEARGEPEVGQLAVAHVTLNRAMEERTSIAEVVRKPYQFSPAEKSERCPQGHDQPGLHRRCDLLPPV